MKKSLLHSLNKVGKIAHFNNDFFNTLQNNVVTNGTKTQCTFWGQKWPKLGDFGMPAYTTYFSVNAFMGIMGIYAFRFSFTQKLLLFDC
jgi:hypothetical protein